MRWFKRKGKPSTEEEATPNVGPAPTKKAPLKDRLNNQRKTKYRCDAVIYMNGKALSTVILHHYSSSGNQAVTELNNSLEIKVVSSTKLKN